MRQAKRNMVVDEWYRLYQLILFLQVVGLDE